MTINFSREKKWSELSPEFVKPSVIDVIGQIEFKK